MFPGMLHPALYYFLENVGPNFVVVSMDYVAFIWYELFGHNTLTIGFTPLFE